MASVGSVAVDFLANTKGYLDGLKIIESRTDATMSAVKSDIDKATQSSEDLGDAIEDVADKSSKTWEESKEKLGDFNEEIQNTHESVVSLADAIIQIGGGLALSAIISDASKAAREYENFAMQMDVLLGNASEAKKAIEDMNKFSLDTPFSPKQVQAAGRALLAFGITTDELIPTLKRLGDVSLATGKDFNDLSIIFGKARAGYYVMADDLNILTESGIPILEQLAVTMGVNVSEVKKLGSESKITFEDLNKAFAATEGPMAKYVGMTETASKTTDGLMSSLEGNIEEFQKSLGEFYNSILRPMVATLLEIANAIIAWAKENPVLAETLRDVIAVTIALGAAILGGAGLVSAFGVLKLGLASATAAIQSFAGAQTSAALGSVAKWAAILGPFAGAGVFALTYTINFVERRRIETEETQVGMAGAAALLTKGEERKQLVGLLTEYQAKLNALSKAQKAAVGDTRNLDQALKEQVDSLKQTVNQIANVNVNQTVLADSLRISTVKTDDLTRASRALTQAQMALKNETKKPTGIAPKGEEDKLKDLKDEIRNTAQEYDGLTNANGEYIKYIDETIRKIGQNKKALDELNKQLKKWRDGFADASRITVEGQLDRSIKTLQNYQTNFISAASKSFGAGDPTLKAVEMVQTLLSQIIETYTDAVNKLKQSQLSIVQSQVQLFNSLGQNALYSIANNFNQQLNLQENAFESIENKYESDVKLLEDANKAKLENIKLFEKQKNDIINSSSDELSEENQRRYEQEIQRINLEYQTKIQYAYATAADSLQANILEQEYIRANEERKTEILEYYRGLEEKKKEEDIKVLENKIAAEQTAIENNNKQIETLNENFALAMKGHQEELERIAKDRAKAEYEVNRTTFYANKLARHMEYELQKFQAVAAYNTGAAQALVSGNPISAAAYAIYGQSTLANTLASLNIMQLANAAQEFPPMQFADGGMVGGNLHSQGGTLIEAERGEFVINRQSTMDNLGLLQAINDGRDIGGNTINLAVTNNISGVNDVEAIAEQIGFSIMQKVKSANYRFA